MVQTAAAATPNDRTLERKRQILDAASRVFRRRGLHAAGMREVAAESGMHVGNLYYYFRNKQEILAFCQEDALSRLLELARQVAALPAPADEKLRRLIAGHVLCLNEETPGSLAHLEVEALEPTWRTRILPQREAYEAALRRLIQEGMDDGTLTAGDAKVAAMAILGALNWTVKWFRPEGGRSAGEIGAAFARQLVDGLLPAGGTRVPA